LSPHKTKKGGGRGVDEWSNEIDRRASEYAIVVRHHSSEIADKPGGVQQLNKDSLVGAGDKGNERGRAVGWRKAGCGLPRGLASARSWRGKRPIHQKERWAEVFLAGRMGFDAIVGV